MFGYVSNATHIIIQEAEYIKFIDLEKFPFLIYKFTLLDSFPI